MTCPACGAENDAEARFCRRCGTSFDVDATTRIPTQDAGDEPQVHDPQADTGEIAVVTSTPPDAGVRTCPSCDARNSARRVLCGRCGADLDTGVRRERPARPTTAKAATASSADRDGPSPGARWTVGVITAGLLIGGGVGAMVALDLGPFAGEPEGPPTATFDAGAYDELPVRLSGVQVGASSVHEPEPDRRFDPPLMLDGDLTTAWNSSGDTRRDGVDERIAVEFPQPIWLTSITFGNGDQLDDDTFLANARAAQVVVRFDAGRTITVSLRDEQGLQAVELPEPILTTGVFLDVVEVVPGGSQPDLAMSELSFQGHVASGDDRQIADARKRFPRVRRTEG